MIFINNRIPKLRSSQDLSDLINICKKTTDFESMEICVPNSIGFKNSYTQNDIGLINKNTCFGCLCCVEGQDANSFDDNGIPTISNNNYQFKEISKTLFQGEYVQIGPYPDKFLNHSSINEKAHTTPIAANLLLFLSNNHKEVILRCSPNWELSIITTDPDDPREGHLDLAILNCLEKIALVGEVKSSVEALLRDKQREQWSRYRLSLLRDIEKYGYKVIFIYIIGGFEYSLYPPTATECPKFANDRREEFYNYIKDGNKCFISLESLRALKLQKLVSHKNWCWENWFLKILTDQNILGLVTGGFVDLNLYLNKCPWM